MGRGACRSRPGGVRGDHRPRGPAAAAAHQVRAGQEAGQGAAWRSAQGADHQAVDQGQARRIRHALTMVATTSAASVGTAIQSLSARAFEIPTATEKESDGTLVWNSTTLVLAEAQADGVSGIGYTYAHAAAAVLINDKLASVVEGADALMPEKAWAELQVQARQLGHAGVA